MKSLLLRKVHVIDPGGPAHDSTVDVLVEKGRIQKIGNRIPKGKATEMRVPGLHISPGWLDLRAHFRDPGEEYKQGLLNGLDAAAAGGYTGVAVLPSTDPPIDSRAGVDHLLRKAADHAVTVHPIAALSRGLQGERMAELFDLHDAGAVAFSDDQAALRSGRLLLLAMQYAGPLGVPVIVFPNDPEIQGKGSMHEGPMSTRLGLRGMPAMAETIRLSRDLQIQGYTGTRMHVATVSTAEGVQLIRQAKAAGALVTASVSAHHLLLNDGCLRGFDTRYKLNPPLRSTEHVDALRQGVKDGTLSCIVSDHRPEDVENKEREFDQAAFGAVGLETCFAAANTALKAHVPLREMIKRFCHGPRAALGMTVPHIAEGAEAEITLFDPEMEWTCRTLDIVSRSKNSPLIGHPLTGRPLGVIAKGRALLRLDELAARAV